MANGGSASCATSGWLQTTTGVSGLATAPSDAWWKIRFKVDTLRALGSGSSMSLFSQGQLSLASDNFDIGYQGNGSSHYTVKGVFRNNSFTQASGGTDLQTALPANGNYVVQFSWYSVTLGTCGTALQDDSGNLYAHISISSVTGTLGGSGYGLIAVNDCNIASFDTDAANVYNGIAGYLAVPPSVGALASYGPPSINDSGLAYLSFMNDATGSSAAAAQVGTQSLGDNGTVTYSGPSGLLWGPIVVPHARVNVYGYSAMHRRTRW